MTKEVKDLSLGGDDAWRADTVIVSRESAPGDMESGGRRVGSEPLRRYEEFTPAGLMDVGMSVLGHSVTVTEVSMNLGHRCLARGC